MSSNLKFSLGLMAAFGFVIVGTQMAGGTMGSLFHFNSVFFILAAVILAYATHSNNLDKFVAACARNSLYAGLLGFISFYIHVMENLDKPDRIGGGISVAFIPLVYAVVVFIICKSFTERKLFQTKGGAQAEALSLQPLLAVTACVSLLVSLLFVILFALNKTL